MPPKCPKCGRYRDGSCVCDLNSAFAAIFWDEADNEPALPGRKRVRNEAEDRKALPAKEDSR